MLWAGPFGLPTPCMMKEKRLDPKLFFGVNGCPGQEVTPAVGKFSRLTASALLMEAPEIIKELEPYRTS